MKRNFSKDYKDLLRYIPVKDLILLESSNPVVLTLIEKSIALFERLTSERGLEKAIAYFKRSRLHFTRFMSGHPLKEVDGVKIDARGLPRWMELPEMELNSSDTRCILTLLTLGRCFRTKTIFKSDTITNEWCGALPDFSRRELQHILRSLGVGKWDWEWSRYHYTTKSGPNGQALATSKYDLAVLPEELKRDLKILGGDAITHAMEQLQTCENKAIGVWYQVFGQPQKEETRKLAVFADPEGKTRIIAILDYWSQTVLRPLHDRLNRILERIPSDCTFKQDNFRNCLPSSGPYYSLDLTAATDRMPIALQKVLLTEIVGKDKTEAWARVLVDYGYSYGAEKFFYKTGQPMGAYSSWPVMALTHHFITRLAALKVGKPHFRDYALLGDDIVIANKEVAEKYVELLETLDMPISFQKTHVSEDTYEFAKRWIQNGVEITPFSFSGLKETWKRYYLYSNFIENQQLHGWLKQDGDPELLLGKMMQLRKKWSQASRSIKLYQIFTLLRDVLKDTPSQEAAGLEISRILGLPVPEGYTPASWIKELVTAELVKQCTKEAEKLWASRADFSVRIYYGLEEILPDEEEFHSILQTLTDHSPLLASISYLQEKNMKLIEQLKEGTPDEIHSIITGKDLVGSSINLNVFSMRSATSKVTSASTVVKPLMNEWKKYLQENLRGSYL